MEENRVNMGQENQPIGSLFDAINYYSTDDLEKFISSLNQEQSIYCLVQAAQAAHRRQAFTMVESEVVSKSIRALSLKPNKIKNNATVEKDN